MSSLGIGKLLVVGFVLAQAFRDVYLGHVFQTEHLAAVMFLVSAMSAPLFGSLWFAQSRGRLRLAPALWPHLLWVNVTTAAAWLSYFYALKGLEPASVNLFHEGAIPLGVLLLGLAGLTPGGPRVRRIERLFLLGIAFSLCLMSWVVLSGRSGFTWLDPTESWVMVVLAISSGLFIAASFVAAQRLNQAGLSATGVMATRFFALMLVSGAVAWLDSASIEPATVRIALGGGLLILGPIYALQLALARVPAITVGVLTSLGPVAIFVLQLLDQRIEVSTWTLTSILTYSAFSICANLARSREESRQKR